MNILVSIIFVAVTVIFANRAAANPASPSLVSTFMAAKEHVAPAPLPVAGLPQPKRMR